jgi:hypothetical protein
MLYNFGHKISNHLHLNLVSLCFKTKIMMMFIISVICSSNVSLKVSKKTENSRISLEKSSREEIPGRNTFRAAMQFTRWHVKSGRVKLKKASKHDWKSSEATCWFGGVRAQKV